MINTCVRAASALTLLLLSACNDNSTPDSTILLPDTGNVTIVKNEYVNCGDLEQQLKHSLPYLLQKKQDWVVLGSSSAAGAGASNYQNSWAGMLASQYADVTVHNFARGGYRTYQALSSDCIVNLTRPQPDEAHNFEKAMSVAPDLVIISFPSNDQASGYANTEALFNLLALRAMFESKGVPVVILSAQPRNVSLQVQQALSEFYTVSASTFSPCFVDVFQPMVSGVAMLKSDFDSGDGVHPNDAGHRVIFQQLMAMLNAKHCVDYQG
ncbi:SGNH/GDSL hydrolase family protein [Rheinheimera baltica]|uniref:SGNH/GDSL hydrolase family protein n=1 Tax=Rheinheimera baltica TaxID=67576 RepID=A0ABT9I2C2_9GAMM|nr:SGNH/GDSL hydrolase family protein [Rheinheimera baltica]MDP5137507.1 SGNH/GDSL hydrolase family protein [Rheinheimera baltica]